MEIVFIFLQQVTIISCSIAVGLTKKHHICIAAFRLTFEK